MQLPESDAHERVRETAFGLLVTRQRPVGQDELAAAVGVRDIAPMLDALTEAGWLDRGLDGSVIGSAGLTLGNGPHGLALAGGVFRTWCGYDALGIPAAMHADATVETSCGVCGKLITIHVASGAPDRVGPEALWLAAGDGDLRTSFCTPTVILCGPEHGAVWAERQGGAGELVDLATAAERGAADWAAAAAAATAISASSTTEIEYVGGPMNSRHESVSETPLVVPGTDGEYRRSVRCADDGALRYVWHQAGASAPSS